MLEAFTAALSLITASEIGDKTFFMAVILASRYPRKPVFCGVVLALAAMTILSVWIGELLVLLPRLFSQYLPPSLGFLSSISIDRVAALLFLIFGIKLDTTRVITVSQHASTHAANEHTKNMEYSTRPRK